MKQCLEWQGGRRGDGYGIFWSESRQQRAHVKMWEAWNNQKVPSGLFIIHSCDNPPCINPFHLRLGTHDDNMSDMKRRGRANGGMKPQTSCAKGHELTSNNVYHYSSGKRRCATCHKEWKRKRYASGYRSPVKNT